MARPVYWTEDKKKQAIADILEHVSSGKSVKSLIDSSDREVIPSYPTFCEWLNEDDELAKNYTRSCEQRADTIFEEILEIADDSSRDTIEMDLGDGVTASKVDYENIQRSRLKIDARKWVLGRMNPKKYGDKTDITSGGNPLPSVPPIIKFVENNNG